MSIAAASAASLFDTRSARSLSATPPVQSIWSRAWDSFHFSDLIPGYSFIKDGNEDWARGNYKMSIVEYSGAAADVFLTVVSMGGSSILEAGLKGTTRAGVRAGVELAGREAARVGARMGASALSLAGRTMLKEGLSEFSARTMMRAGASILSKTAMSAATGAGIGAVMGGGIGYLYGGWEGALEGAAGGILRGSIQGGLMGLTSWFANPTCFTDRMELLLGQRVATEPLGREIGGVQTAAPASIICEVARNVSQIKAGDLVASVNEADPSGKVVYRAVEEVFENTAYDLHILKLRDSNGIEHEMYSTAEHVVYILEEGWICARAVRVGDQFIERGGGLSTVTGIRHEQHPGGIKVYNFRVAGTHTYFVRQAGSQAEPVWVHNSYNGLFAEEEAVANGSWKTRVEFGGRRVYQRADLFDPLARDVDGLTNIQRMASGRAPIGFDGEAVELHHLIQSEPGPIAEISYTLHDQVPHGLAEAGGSFRYSANGMATEAQLAFNRWKYNYWQWRAGGF